MREQALRQRAAEVLRELHALAGRPSNAEIARQSQLAGQEISDQTVANLLSGTTAARTRSVLAFIAACLHLAGNGDVLSAEQDTISYWKGRFDDAAGRATDPEAGLVRVGVPPRQADAFITRPALDVLYRAVDTGKSVVLTSPANLARTRVLSGLGGVGKTQLAAQYAREVWRDPTLDLAVWVSARTTDSVISSYARGAERLLGADPTDPEQAARQLMEWLATTAHPWLIVLDDVQTPADIGQWWPEPTESGQVIVTTRYRGEAVSRPDQQLIEVDTYTDSEALLFLRGKLANHPRLFAGSDEPDNQLMGLAADLGQLPLALAHATAFMINSNETVQGYRRRFAQQRTRLTDLFPRRREIPDGYQDTVDVTWAISLELAEELAPSGVSWPVMLVVSLLDPTGIPAAMFTTEALSNYVHGLLGRPVGTQDIHDAVWVLHRLNLLTVDPEAPQTAVRVHSLVQRATRESYASEVVADSAYAAADSLLELWPDVERDRILTQALRANSNALRANAQDSLWDPDGHDLLFRVGHSLGESGFVTDAINYCKEMAVSANRYLGPDHLATLAARSELARWYSEAGDSIQATADFEKLLADYVRLVGPDNRNTLNARNSLAICRGEAGDSDGAVRDFENLLADYMRLLGADDPRTLGARANLARWRGETGDLAGAITATEELVADYVRLLGPSHPDTLRARHNLASWRVDAADPAQAAPELEKVVSDVLSVFGPDHPHTLDARQNFAAWRAQNGDPAGAATEAEQLLADALRLLGPDHPRILTIRKKLARWRGEAGDPAGAAMATENLLIDQLRLLAPDDDAITVTRNDLIRLYGEAGDATAAANAAQDLLGGMLRKAGPDHPDTLSARGELARWRAEVGDPGAINDFEQLIADKLRVLGRDHPDILITRHNLARCRGVTGDPAGAAAAFEELLSEQLRLLGSDHPDILATRYDLARWRGAASDPTGAAAATEELLADQVRVFGSDSPVVLGTRSNLASWRGEAGDPLGAIADLERLLPEMLRILRRDDPKIAITFQNLNYWRQRAIDTSTDD